VLAWDVVQGDLEDLVQLISQRAGRCVERQGLLEQDAERTWLELEPADDTDATPDTREEGHAVKRGGPCPRYWAAPFPIGLLSAHSKVKKRS